MSRNDLSVILNLSVLFCKLEYILIREHGRINQYLESVINIIITILLSQNVYGRELHVNIIVLQSVIVTHSFSNLNVHIFLLENIILKCE